MAQPVGEISVMRDIEIINKAVEDAQTFLRDYIEPGRDVIRI